MLVYFIGCLVMIFFGIIKTIVHAKIENSLSVRNLCKIGYKFNWFAGAAEATNRNRFLPYLFFTFFIHPIFSWFAVIYFTANVIFESFSKIELPDKIRELRLILATVDLTQHEVVEILRKIDEIGKGYLEQLKTK